MTGTATSVAALIGIALSRSRICFACQLSYQVKEPVGLADEQPVGREGFYRRHRTACVYRGRPNDRNRREFSAEERAWLGHDQIGLEVLQAERRWGWERRHIEVRKRETAIGQRSQRIRNRVARLVVPGLEVGGLGRADTEQDPQDLWMGYPLGQGRVEAAATYLDEGEMECRRVGTVPVGDCRYPTTALGGVTTASTAFATFGAELPTALRPKSNQVVPSANVRSIFSI